MRQTNPILKSENGCDNLKEKGGISMCDLELLELAQNAGFHAAVISAADVPVDGAYRKFCEDNL